MTKLCSHENAHHAFLDRIWDRQFILCQECHREIEGITFELADVYKKEMLLRKKYKDFLDNVNGIDLDEMKD